MSEIPSSEEKPEPTENDRRNAETRRAIAEKMRAEYGRCIRLALGVLGPGFTPWMKLVLIDSDHRRNGNIEPVATVYKVYRGEERLTENSMYVMEREGEILTAKSYEELLGDRLHEKHPSYGFEHNGEWKAFDRWTLCWGAIELYEPRSPEQLANLRESRGRKKAEREEKAWKEANPLLAWAGLDGRDEDAGETGGESGLTPRHRGEEADGRSPVSPTNVMAEEKNAEK